MRCFHTGLGRDPHPGEAGECVSPRALPSRGSRGRRARRNPGDPWNEGVEGPGLRESREVQRVPGNRGPGHGVGGLGSGGGTGVR